MIAIFIAKKPDGGRSEFYTLYPDGTDWEKDARFVPSGRGGPYSGKKQGTCHSRSHVCNSGSERLVHVIINSDDMFLAKEECRKRISDDTSAGGGDPFKALADYIEGRLKVLNVSPLENEQVYLFVHWGKGGGKPGVAFLDARFQKLWEESHYRNWRVGTISSVRSHIFNVVPKEGENILLPHDGVQVEKLWRDLREETQYWNYEAQDISSIQFDSRVIAALRNVRIYFIATAASPFLLNKDLMRLACKAGANAELVTALDGEGDSGNDTCMFFSCISDVKDVIDGYPIFIEWGRNSAQNDSKQNYGLVECGYHVPREFVLSCKVSGGDSDDMKGMLSTKIIELAKRVSVWREMHSEVSVNELRDWCMGALRKRLFLDEDVHGGTGLINVRAVKVKPQEQYQTWKVKIASRLESFVLKRWGNIFEIEALRNLLDENDVSDSGGWWERFFRILLPLGTEVAYMSPTCKIRVLLFDDDEKPDILDVDCVKRSLQIDHRRILTERNENVVQKLLNSFVDIRSNNKTYDVVLLDLRLGDLPGADPSGYQLIHIIKRFFPSVPVIVYSQYDDMGHMSRAFKTGADWFIRKDESYKLPRHINSLFLRKEWRVEWNAVSELNLCNRLLTGEGEAPYFMLEKTEAWFINSFDDKRRYLTYKILENLPGFYINIIPLKGGMSSAITFKAQKGEARLQNPVIVKIDTAFNTMTEYDRYFRFIRPYLSNECGRVVCPELVLDDENAVIVYTFAGKQNERYELVSMKQMLERDVKNRSSCMYESYEKALDIIFNEILLRIHGVRPNREFDRVDAYDYEKFSDFPNRSFGEVEIDAEQGKPIPSKYFVANWLCRMPLGRELKAPQFIAQDASNDKTPHYEFHRKEIVNEGRTDEYCVIEALDFEDKCTIVMTGANVEHVVKYRPHTYPCMTLWVDREANQEIILESAIPKMVKKAIEKLHGNKEMGQYRASNEFAEILKRLMNEPLSAGRPSDDFYKMKDPKDKVRGSEFWEGAFLEIDNKENTAFNTLPSLFKAAKELLNGTLAKKIMECPAGIVHGDLNYANIMLETKKRLSGDSVFTTDISDVKDVWLIDFARTRRDLIAHDFNVLFTSTLGLLFDLDVWRSEETIAHDIYYCSMRQLWGERVKVNDTISYNRFIETIFRPFVVRAVFDKLDAVPDGMEHDNRLVLIFKILRRIRAAALKAGMTEESYAFTTALACMVASRVYIVHEENAPAAAAMIATAFICLAKLKRVEMEANNG